MGFAKQKIENPNDLFNHSSVWVKAWGRHSPTSFLISLQFRILKGLMDIGIYEFEANIKSTKSFIEKIK